MSFLYWGKPELDTVLQEESQEGGVEEENHSPRPTGHVFYRPLRIWLPFWAASTHCQPMFKFLPTSIPKYFSAGLLSIHSFPRLYWQQGFP